MEHECVNHSDADLWVQGFGNKINEMIEVKMDLKVFWKKKGACRIKRREQVELQQSRLPLPVIRRMDEPAGI